ncbi:extracellular solute-binding protein [Quadrisphaera setariae]|uniref:Extracellular solute-binding protein n=1 Tax=Quadrisphaera setariae TaxID=2593304 RepID=A0A5C8ZLE4_9ACTN|nr:extracellular solute-binding protein [Quadrisphaera setariae]TXR57969.1 extracellular solute-binding protein [Quadrisphaera setariae]
MQRRRIAGIAAAAVTLSLAMTACGSSGGSGSGDGDSKTVTVVYQKTASFTQLDDVLTKAKGEYESAHPGMKVELKPIESEADQYFTKLALMNKSKDTAPDVIYEDSFQVRSDAAAGYLAPMDEQLKGWSDWSQFDDTAKQAGLGDDGKTYGVSMGTDTRAIYYNKTLFAQAGLPTDWKPKTWDDVLTAARAVKEKVPGVIPLNIYGSKAGGEQTSMQGFEMLMYGTKDPLYDTSSKKWLTGSKGFGDSLGFYKTVFSEGLGPSQDVALDSTLGSQISTTLIPQGKVAMAIDGSWLPGQWLKGDNAWPQWQETMGFAPMPTQDGSAPGSTSMSGGWLLSVGANAPDKQAAFDFVSTALNKENALKYGTEASQIAVRKDVATDPAYLSYNPSFEFFSSLVPVTHFRPATPDYSQISSNIQVAVESVVTGSSSPADAAKAYDEALVGIVGKDNTQAAS